MRKLFLWKYIQKCALDGSLNSNNVILNIFYIEMNTNILVLVVLALFSQVATIYGQRPTRKDVHLNIPIEIHLNNKAYLMHNRLMPRFQRLDLFYYMTAYHHSIIKSVSLNCLFL